MCQSCVEIDKQVERYSQLLTTDAAEVERIKQLISKLYADRVRLHQNPETVYQTPKPRQQPQADPEKKD